jgi:hypothetical protein
MCASPSRRSLSESCHKNLDGQFMDIAGRLVPAEHAIGNNNGVRSVNFGILCARLHGKSAGRLAGI